MSHYLQVENPDSIALRYERKIVADSMPQIGSQQPNVVLVICESFSAYKSSMYGNPLNTTPFLMIYVIMESFLKNILRRLMALREACGLHLPAYPMY